MGTKSFIIFYLSVGFCSGLFAWFVSFGYPAVIMGASGAVFGIFAAYAVFFPERLVTLLLFFVMPVTMKAKYLVMIFAGMEVLFLLSDSASGVARYAHIAGLFFGFVFIKRKDLVLLVIRKFNFRKRPKLRIVIKGDFNRDRYISDEN